MTKPELYSLAFLVVLSLACTVKPGGQNVSTTAKPKPSANKVKDPEEPRPAVEVEKAEKTEGDSPTWFERSKEPEKLTPNEKVGDSIGAYVFAKECARIALGLPDDAEFKIYRPFNQEENKVDIDYLGNGDWSVSTFAEYAENGVARKHRFVAIVTCVVEEDSKYTLKEFEDHGY